MNQTYSFVADGDPKGQPRVKATKVGGFIRVYTPGTANDFKAGIKDAATKAGLRGKMLLGPISLTVDCFFARPKGHFKGGKNADKLKDSAPRWHVSRPDFDNIVKAGMDALTNIGVWKDDSQVCDATVTKTYTDTFPQTRITIKCL